MDCVVVVERGDERGRSFTSPSNFDSFLYSDSLLETLSNVVATDVQIHLAQLDDAAGENIQKG